MCFRLVSIDHEYQLDLPFDVDVEVRLYELLSHGDSPEKAAKAQKILSRRLVDLISAMLAGELLPPTDKQLKYAIGIARELSLEIPPEVLRYRDAMTVFLGQNAAKYRDSKQRRVAATKS